jgi:hypothetical protein
MIKIPYAFKVMIQELMGLGIAPRLRLRESGEGLMSQRRVVRPAPKK